MPRLLSSTLALLFCSTALVAQAGDPAIEQAKAHFATAQQHFKLGRFEDALAEYTSAYEAKALPAFLFNIGQCERKLEHFGKAVFFYQAYLRDMPEAPNRETVEALITRCEEQHQKQKARQAEAARVLQAAEKARLEAEAEKAHLEAEKTRLETERQAAWLKPPPPPGKRPEETPTYKKAWFWAVIGSVAAAAVAGGVAAGVSANRGGSRTVLPTGSLGAIDFRDVQ